MALYKDVKLTDTVAAPSGLGGSTLADMDYGDITVSASGTIMTIDNGLNVSKLADGSISNTEFQYLNNVSGNIQSQIDGKQPLDATLTALAGVTTSSDKIIYATGSDVFNTTTLTSYIRTLLDDSTAVLARATLGLGTAATSNTGDFQAPLVFRSGVINVGNEISLSGVSLNALLTVTPAADTVPYFTSSSVASVTTLSSYGRTLIDDTDATTARSTLGLGTLAVLNSITSSSVTDFSEAVDDRVGTLLTAGSGVTIAYDDAANTLDLSLRSIGPSGFLGNITRQSGTPLFMTPAQARQMLRKEKYRIPWTPTVNWSLDNGLYQDFAPSGTFTLNFPTNVVEGESAFIYVYNNTSGTAQITFASGYKAPGGISGVQLTASGNRLDRLEFFFHHVASCTVTVTKDIY